MRSNSFNDFMNFNNVKEDNDYRQYVVIDKEKTKKEIAKIKEMQKSFLSLLKKVKNSNGA